MAEALLKGLDHEHFDVTSAGIEPAEMHPFTVEVMKEVGVDLGRKVAKATREVLSLPFDYVITLCDRAKSECPRFSTAELVHWHFDKPFLARDPEKQKRLFRSLRDQIAQRVRLFALVQARSTMPDRHTDHAA